MRSPRRRRSIESFQAALLALALALWPLGVASGDDGLSDERILGPAPGMTLQSLRLRMSSFEQDGHGYQSQAERPSVAQKGREFLLVNQPQLEMVATQGRFTHRLWVPVDIVTAASVDAIDAMSSASRQNEAASFDLTNSYHGRDGRDVFVRSAVHMEEPFRSFQFGTGISESFAEDNAVIALSANQSLDEFDRFDFHGDRMGRTYRGTSNANLGFTQLLSATTVANASYGGTIQVGELSNTWNAVPLANGHLGREILPRQRYRHALVGRIMQALPWDGALHASYRFYADSWHVLAHTIDASLFQRLTRAVYMRFGYRFHDQRSPSFWTSAAPSGKGYRTADSDLASLRAHTLGGALVLDLPNVARVQYLHVDLGYDRYFRSNDLHVNVFTCGVGFRF